MTVLEAVFQQNKYPNAALRKQLSKELGMRPRSLQKWFQNRRFKESNRRKKAKLEGIKKFKRRISTQISHCSQKLTPSPLDEEPMTLMLRYEAEPEVIRDPPLFGFLTIAANRSVLEREETNALRFLYEESSDREFVQFSQTSSFELLESLYGSSWFDVLHIFFDTRND